MRWIIFLFLILAVLIVVSGVIVPQITLKLATHKKAIHKEIMTITSSAFTHDQLIPSKYTCDGANVNPPLTFTDIPQKAQSLVLLVDDPDAPSGTWHHWTVFNMSPNTKEIAENSKPTSGHEGLTSFGKTGYGGPCPPTGVHNYIFTLYALDDMLDLPNNATYNEIKNILDMHVIDQAELIGRYSRSR